METALKAIAAPRRRQILAARARRRALGRRDRFALRRDAPRGLTGSDAAEGGRARGRTTQRHQAPLPRAPRGSRRAARRSSRSSGTRGSMRSNVRPNERRGRRMETTTERLVYERELQIAASPETVWEFLVDPGEGGALEGAAGDGIRPAAGRRLSHRDHPGPRRERRVRRARPAAADGLHVGLGAGRGRPEPGAAGLLDGRDRARARGRRHEAPVHAPRPAERRGGRLATRSAGTTTSRGSPSQPRAAIPGPDPWLAGAA